MKLITSGRYAAVTSTLALVVALGGTSYAAVRITGHDIKDGTVTTADVKNHNLRLKDFSATAKSGLTGARGAKGATGEQGVQGVQGEPGPSDAFAAGTNLQLTQSISASSTDVAELSLPAGSYVAQARTVVQHNDGGGAQTAAGVTTCELIKPVPSQLPVELDVANIWLPDGLLVSGALNLQAAFTLDAAQDVIFRCATTGTHDAVNAVQLQAVKVATLTVQDQP